MSGNRPPVNLMIFNDEQLKQAQQAIVNLQRILLQARKAHSPTEYKVLAEPVLLEIQQREQDIMIYLSASVTEPLLTIS